MNRGGGEFDSNSIRLAGVGQSGGRNPIRFGTRAWPTFLRIRVFRLSGFVSQALRQEVAYASYLSLTTIILPPPRPENHQYLTDYARAVNGALASSWHINVCRSLSPSPDQNSPRFRQQQIAIRIPVNLNSASPLPGSSFIAEDDPATWEAWNTIRSICGYSPRLSLSEFSL